MIDASSFWKIYKCAFASSTMASIIRSATSIQLKLSFLNRNIFILASSTNNFLAVIAVRIYASNTFLSAMFFLNAAQKKLNYSFILPINNYSAFF
jgi:hypothetical protein